VHGVGAFVDAVLGEIGELLIGGFFFFERLLKDVRHLGAAHKLRPLARGPVAGRFVPLHRLSRSNEQRVERLGLLNIFDAPLRILYKAIDRSDRRFVGFFFEQLQRPLDAAHVLFGFAQMTFERLFELFIIGGPVYEQLDTVNLSMLNGIPVITDIHAPAVFDPDNGDVSEVDYEFRDVGFPASLPAWYFDPAVYGAHRTDVPD